MSTNADAHDIPCFERDGGVMPVLGLGTFQSKGDACSRAVSTALRLGYRHIDTARMYENETQVGRGIRESGVPRDQIFLTTKLQMGQLDADGVRASCERSLQDLGFAHVDLLLIHWPESDVPLDETLGAMAELKREGKIRHLGVSNFTVEWMHKAVHATDEPIFCNQIEYHPYIDQTPPMDTCRERDIAIVAYSPLARGRVPEDARLAEIGRKHGKTGTQVALRWLIRQDDVIAIPKGSSEAHIRDNLAVFDFDLDDRDMAAIAAFERGQRLIDPDFAPTWDT